MKFHASPPEGASESDARASLRSLISTGLNPPVKPENGKREAKKPRLTHTLAPPPSLQPRPPANHAALLAVIAKLPPATLLFLEKQSGMTGTAEEIRTQFSAWCAAQPSTWHDWRKAWERFSESAKRNAPGGNPAAIPIAVVEAKPVLVPILQMKNEPLPIAADPLPHVPKRYDPLAFRRRLAAQAA